MKYVGIDIGKESHVAAMLNADGTPCMKPLKLTNNVSGYQSLLKNINDITTNTSDIIIGMEATGHYWLNIYEKLAQDGYQITVLNPLQVKSFRNRGIRGSKTDVIDAKLIAQILRFGETLDTKIAESAMLGLKYLTRYRSDVAQSLSMTKNKVITLLDQVFPEFAKLFSDMFGKAALSVLKEAATPQEIIDLDERKLCTILDKASRGRLSKKQTIKIKQAAENSFGLRTASNIFSLQIKLIIAQIEQLKNTIMVLDKEIEKLYKNLDVKLTTLPGVGIINAATIIAEIEDINKFHSKSGGAAALVAFAGMDPKLKQSGKFNGQVKMSKRGSRYLRRTVYLASFAACRKNSFFKSLYDKHRAKGKSHKVALSHVGVKMLHVIHSMLKNNTSYTICQ